MGVGPPRFGLRPGVGRKPGIDPTRAHAVLRYIEFPNTATFPGRGLRTVVRFATVPGLTLYPSTNRLIRGAPEVFTRTLTLLGSGVFSTLRGRFTRHRTLTFLGDSLQRISGFGHGPSFLGGRIPTVVSFSSPYLYADFAFAQETVEFESGTLKVEV